MSKNASDTIKLTLDSENLPPCTPAMTAQECAELEAVAAMPDAQIHYSDESYLPDAVWMKPTAELPHTKRQTKEEKEDYRAAAEVLERLRKGQEQVHSAADVRKDLGLILAY